MMKKAILAAIAVLTAAMLCACGSPIPAKEAVSASTDAHIENMSAEAAAGNYALSNMSAIGNDNPITKDSYTENTLTLTADGTFTFRAVAGEQGVVETGTFTVTPDGVVALTVNDEPFYLVSSTEKILCDGKTVSVVGSLGARASVTMNYTDPDKTPVTDNSGDGE